MIIEMARIRVLGPRRQLGDTLRALQDRGIVHLIDAAPIGGMRHDLDPVARRRRRHLKRALDDIERVIDGLGQLGAPVDDRTGPPPPEGKAAWLAARLAAKLQELRGRARALGDERDALRIYEPLFAEIDHLLRPEANHRVAIFQLRLRSAAALDALHAALARVVGETMEFRPYELAPGETALLLLVPQTRAAEIEHQLTEAGVERAPLPPALAHSSLADALPQLRPRLAEVERELAAVRDDALALARAHGDDLARARRGFHDALLALGAADHATTSARAFALEGWLPACDRAGLAAQLAAQLGSEISVEEIARDQCLCRATARSIRRRSSPCSSRCCSASWSATSSTARRSPRSRSGSRASARAGWPASPVPSRSTRSCSACCTASCSVTSARAGSACTRCGSTAARRCSASSCSPSRSAWFTSCSGS
ncbi:MAG: hypothetical protein E6J90_51790 [Deltaproteobacteria bacterium]|nr:MAG: hypothetical protein E6J90_51790 [Deltaproteobacteria bacterium]